MQSMRCFANEVYAMPLAAAAKAKGETTDIGEQKSWKRERARKSWKYDPGERARRIWEFWRALVVRGSS
jgi:hypothetical protein